MMIRILGLCLSLMLMGCGKDAEKAKGSDAVTTAETGAEQKPAVGLSELSKACDAKDAQACEKIAEKYYRGEGVEKNINISVKFGIRACEGGRAKMCLGLGAIFSRGKDAPVDLARARTFLVKACELQSARGCFMLAKLMVQQKEPLAKALQLLGKACDLKWPEACRRSGTAFLRGEGAPKDAGKAVAFYAKGCALKDMESCYNHGVCYMQGFGVTKDPAKAVALIRKACEGGYKHNDCAKLPPVKSAKGPAAPKKPTAPPSTGREMPRGKKPSLSLPQAKKLLDDAMKAYRVKQPTPNFERIYKALVTALPIVHPKMTPASKEAYVALQRTSRKTRRWKMVVKVSIELLKAFGADGGRPETLILGLSELGDYKRAEAAIKDLEARYPKLKPQMLLSRALIPCQKQDWPGCLKSTSVSIQKMRAQDPQLKSMPAKIVRAMQLWGLAFAGQLERFDSEWDSLVRDFPNKPPPASYIRLRAAINKTRSSQIIIDPVVPPEVPLGIYHLLGKRQNDAIATVAFYNFQNKQRQFRVTVEIPGLTNKQSNSVTVPVAMTKGVPHKVRFTPPLKLDFDIAKIRSSRPATVSLTIEEELEGGTKKSLYHETINVNLLPRDHLPTRRMVGRDHVKETLEYIAAWVMPNAASIDPFLMKAKQHHPRKVFAGMQAPTLPQVKALYDSLKAKGVTYVMDPYMLSTQYTVQRTRLPAEVLESTNAQCLEGTILFASLMEAIGLAPIIVTVPGHAFVGWQLSPGDRAAGVKAETLFLETTMVGVAPFADAVKVATKRVAEERKKGSFKYGLSRLLPVQKLRQAGFHAQPM